MSVRGSLADVRHSTPAFRGGGSDARKGIGIPLLQTSREVLLAPNQPRPSVAHQQGRARVHGLLTKF